MVPRFLLKCKKLPTAKVDFAEEIQRIHVNKSL